MWIIDTRPIRELPLKAAADRARVAAARADAVALAWRDLGHHQAVCDHLAHDWPDLVAALDALVSIRRDL